jgi:hypothetical protein
MLENYQKSFSLFVTTIDEMKCTSQTGVCSKSPDAKHKWLREQHSKIIMGKTIMLKETWLCVHCLKTYLRRSPCDSVRKHRFKLIRKEIVYFGKSKMHRQTYQCKVCKKTIRRMMPAGKHNKRG